MISTLKRERRPKTLTFVVSGVLCLAFIFAWTSPSFAEDLTLSLPSEPEQGFQGQTVGLDLTLSYPGSATASAFQLDIGFDTDALTSPSATEFLEVETTSSTPTLILFRHPEVHEFRDFTFKQVSVAW